MSIDIKTFKFDKDHICEINAQLVSAGELPILSCMAIYREIGLYSEVESYYKDHPDEQPCPFDNIKCNFYTLQRFKNLLNDTWGSYNITIDQDNHVIWTNDRHDKRSRPKTLKAIVRNSVNQDFLNYCPGLDDELEDNIIVFRVYTDEVEVVEVDAEKTAAE